MFFLILYPLTNSYSSSIPNEIRREYATKFHEAFVLQSTGETRRAYYCFKTGQQLAQKAGESSKKVQLICDLFVWYRKYGYSLEIMSTESGCIDEFRSWRGSSGAALLAKIPEYYSEWGNTPEQAAQIREFMMGVGETVSGIFCVTISSGLGTAAGTTLILDGLRRMTLNDLWRDHESSLLEFRQWEKKMQRQRELQN